MPLVRSRSQGNGDLLATHYIDRESDQRWVAGRNAAMRALIAELDRQLPETLVWGLTSHDTLCLMSVPEYDAGPWHVAIDGKVDGGFEVTYRPPEGELPIPRSEIVFRVKGLGESIRFIKQAMALTGGWPDSPDLKT